MAEWENLRSMLRDMSRFARENPEHRFLCADDQHRRTIGFVAFRENAEDEQMQEWSILVLRVRQQGDGAIRSSLGSAVARQTMIQTLVEEARRTEPAPDFVQSPPAVVVPIVPVVSTPRKTRWDLIDFD